MRKTIFGGLISFVLASTVFLLINCGGDTESESESESENFITIGFLAPTKDDPASWQNRFQAAQLAVDEINAAGGVAIDGVDYSFELLNKDSGGVYTKGIEAAQDFVTNNVKFVVGPGYSGVTVGDPTANPIVKGVSQAVTIPNNIMLISGSATSVFLTTLDDNDLVWRTCPSDYFQASIGANYIYDASERNTAGVIYRKDAWGIGLAQAFKKEFEAVGGKIEEKNMVGYDLIDANDEPVDLDTFDYKPLLAKAFEGNPQVIYLVAINEASKITTDIKAGGYLATYTTAPAFFSNDGLTAAQDLLSNGDPEVIEGITGTQPTMDNNDALYKAFAANYKAKFDIDAVAYANNIYDNVYLYAYAIAKAGSLDPNNVKQQLISISKKDGSEKTITINQWAEGLAELTAGNDINYDGASGPIEFTVDGDPGEGKYIIWKIVKDGSSYKYSEEEVIDFKYEE